ncbi:phosphotyrosine protein phosphatase [Endozoicomonas sp. OPT23]|uniref:low molecular weight protein-tyrosine-phosphatase n=1 Tax=Endozoicomonas sp. OPT23 TaxID=2072845 RepID=UPI00129BB38F|nr:low molecular weight protein-tyrosine-phosphatase [Endozoicomonas sp. OPT23]MRI35237.1 phosphotyrosine protein phosphatase [Endozoicomonas sp. OPT23]
MIKVMFVCLGNICRSPTAHGVFEQMVKEQGLEHLIQVESSGTSGWHQGEKPDGRSSAEAANRGYDLSYVRSQATTDADFVEMDYLLAMDADNLVELQSRCPKEYQHKLSLFLSHAELSESEVPDPYYGGTKGFSHVLDLVEAGSRALLEHICSQHSLGNR